MRLAGGNNTKEGRVEIFHDGAWGTVCDDSWDNRDAQVVCRQLGLPDIAARAHQHAHFGQGAGKILLDNVWCVGNETALDQCQHSGWETHDCGHAEDASVTCEQGKIYASSVVKEVKQLKINQLFSTLTSLSACRHFRGNRCYYF